VPVHRRIAQSRMTDTFRESSSYLQPQTSLDVPAGIANERPGSAVCEGRSYGETERKAS